MVCLTRLARADLELSTMIRCCRDRVDVAHDTGRRDALVDPFDGGRNWLFPHNDPPDEGGVRLAATP